jgi:formylglycine-generating enzyme required for sulfatase activity
MKTPSIVIGVAFFGVVCGGQIYADTFGTGSNVFIMDFVEIGNPDNADDSGAGGGIYSSPFGGVAYRFRMAVYEVTQEQVTKATNLGLENVVAGAWTGNQPAAQVSLYEAAAFVNFLNTNTGHHPAYDLTFSGGQWAMKLWSSTNAWQLGGENLYRHKDSYYFLPSEDEWYKSAYHKNDGVTANYWDYPTASNSVPDGLDFEGDPQFEALFADSFSGPGMYEVTNSGSAASPYGTFGQGGLVYEMMESAFTPPNDNSTELRTFRGGDKNSPENALRSSNRTAAGPTVSNGLIGFRIASVPEPSSAALITATAVLMGATRRYRNMRVRL